MIVSCAAAADITDTALGKLFEKSLRLLMVRRINHRFTAFLSKLSQILHRGRAVKLHQLKLLIPVRIWREPGFSAADRIE